MTDESANETTTAHTPSTASPIEAVLGLAAPRGRAVDDHMFRVGAATGRAAGPADALGWLPWDYDAERIHGFDDHDIGAVLTSSAIAADEAEPTGALEAWRLRPGKFRCPWQTDDPR